MNSLPNLKALKTTNTTITPVLKKAIINALSERDETAIEERDAKGNILPDPELKDTENVPLLSSFSLPLPIEYEDKSDKTKLTGGLISRAST